jgi:hypothetical protein
MNKLFVWEDVLIDYTSGVMFALAESVEEARSLIIEKCGYIPDKDLAKEPHVYNPATEKMGFYLWGGS